MNELNLSLQGKGATVFSAHDKLAAIKWRILMLKYRKRST